MSADNGVYILSSLKPGGGYVYRVRDLASIDNLDWDDIQSCDIHDESWTGSDDEREKVRIRNARKMWKGCSVLLSEKEAYKEARKIESLMSWTEYGICMIEVNEVFSSKDKGFLKTD